MEVQPKRRGRPPGSLSRRKRVDAADRAVADRADDQLARDDDHLLPEREARAFLGVGRTFLLEASKRGELAFVRAGDLRRYRLGDLRAFIQANRVGGVVAERSR